MYMSIEINFKKKFGQNFLTDGNLLSAIVADSGVNDQTTVVEVGAGAGALTAKLCQKAKKVFSFEIDTDLVSVLQQNLAEYNNVQVVFKDFLTISNAELMQIVGNNFAVVANLPYNITSPLITKFLTCGANVQSLTVMVQAEVAERIVAKPKTKDYGVLSIMVQLCGTPKITRSVGRQMFTPAPNVDSAIVHINVEQIPQHYTQIVEFVKLCFSARRKTLINNLSKQFDKAVITNCLNKANISVSARAEELTPQQFAELYNLFAKNS